MPWYKQREKGTIFLLKLSFYLVKFCPKFILNLVVFFGKFCLFYP